jgi:hypothetical protein
MAPQKKEQLDVTEVHSVDNLLLRRGVNGHQSRYQVTRFMTFVIVRDVLLVPFESFMRYEAQI